MARERVTLWTSAAASGATFVAVAISAVVIWNSAGKQQAQFETEMAALNAKLDAANAKIDGASETVTEIKKIASLETTTKALGQLNSEIKKTNDGLAKLQQISSLDGVKATLAKLDSKIDTTSAALVGLQKSAAADLVKGDLAGIENRLASLDGVKAALAKLDSKIDTTSAALAGLQKSAAADLVKGDLAGIQNRLASLATSIETRLAATDKSLAEIKTAKENDTQAAGDSARDKADAARDQAIARLESIIGDLKTGIVENASSQNKSLAGIEKSILALKTSASAAQVAAQQAAQKAEKTAVVARPPEPSAPDITSSIPIEQPQIVRFGAVGRANLDVQTNAVIANLKTIMKGRQGCAISVAGYSDTYGSDDANLDVSQQRADMVGAKLKIAFAGQTVQIDSVGWGERRLKVWTPDGKVEMANRRVEVSVDCKG